jgi:hypothetical protein
MIALVAQDKIDAALAKEFDGVKPERKQILLQSARNAIGRGVGADLHKNFSENLQGGELAFYKEIVVVTPEDGAAGAAAASQPNPPAPSPEAAADAHSEGADAADAASARSRGR